MQSVNIICIGKIKEKYLTQGCDEYIKRLQLFCKLNIIEIPEYKLPENASQSEINKCIQIEGERILSKMKASNSNNIAMCIEGEMLSSQKLADKIKEYEYTHGGKINFIIGGSYGLSDEVKKACQFKFSMSRLTFTHQLARMVLLEQVYRAFNINNNGKYHK